MQRCTIGILVGLVFAAGCGGASEAGRGAAKGALNEVREQSEHPEQGPPPLAEATKTVVAGALAELDTPERHAELARIVAAMTQGALDSAAGNPNLRFGWGGGPASPNGVASSSMPPFSANAGPIAALGGRFSEGFTMGMSHQLQTELGPSGDGPLAKSLASATERLSGAAASGFAQGLAPELGGCNGADRSRCTEQRVQELSRSAAVGFAEGFGSALRIPLLIAGFIAGVAVALLAVFASRLLRPRARA